jgi:hypothetical protein
MKETEDSEKFSEEFGPFAAKHRQAVWAEVLKPRREVLSNPEWRPSWIEGMGYAGEVHRIAEALSLPATILQRLGASREFHNLRGNLFLANLSFAL